VRGRRRLHIEVVYKHVRFTKSYQGYQIKEYEMGRACSMHGIHEKCIQNFDEKTGKSLLGRHRRRWEDNISSQMLGKQDGKV
jgi:hypothetical protein